MATAPRHPVPQPDGDESFRDGLGVRVHVTDEASGDTIERLYLSPDLARVGFAVDERTSRLVNFRHARFARLRGVDAEPDGSSVWINTERIPGVRLFHVLQAAEQGRVKVDINTALQIAREILPALATLHDSRNVTHGALGPERLILTLQARIAIVDHGLGAALAQLQYPRTRLWREFRIAMPPAAGVPRFDARADVAMVAMTVLAALLGRPITLNEFPDRIRALLDEVRERPPSGRERALSASLRAWLERTLPIESRRPLGTALEAQVALEEAIKKERAYAPGASALKHFVERLGPLMKELAAPAAPAVAERDSTPEASDTPTGATVVRLPGSRTKRAPRRPTPEEEQAEEIAFLERELARLAAEEAGQGPPDAAADVTAGVDAGAAVSTGSAAAPASPEAASGDTGPVASPEAAAGIDSEAAALARLLDDLAQASPESALAPPMEGPAPASVLPIQPSVAAATPSFHVDRERLSRVEIPTDDGGAVVEILGEVPLRLSGSGMDGPDQLEAVATEDDDIGLPPPIQAENLVLDDPDALARALAALPTSWPMAAVRVEPAADSSSDSAGMPAVGRASVAGVIGHAAATGSIETIAETLEDVWCLVPPAPYVDPPVEAAAAAVAAAVDARDRDTLWLDFEVMHHARLLPSSCAAVAGPSLPAPRARRRARLPGVTATARRTPLARAVAPLAAARPDPDAGRSRRRERRKPAQLPSTVTAPAAPITKRRPRGPLAGATSRSTPLRLAPVDEATRPLASRALPQLAAAVDAGPAALAPPVRRPARATPHVLRLVAPEPAASGAPAVRSLAEPTALPARTSDDRVSLALLAPEGRLAQVVARSDVLRLVSAPAPSFTVVARLTLIEESASMAAPAAPAPADGDVGPASEAVAEVDQPALAAPAGAASIESIPAAILAGESETAGEVANEATLTPERTAGHTDPVSAQPSLSIPELDAALAELTLEDAVERAGGPPKAPTPRAEPGLVSTGFDDEVIAGQADAALATGGEECIEAERLAAPEATPPAASVGLAAALEEPPEPVAAAAPDAHAEPRFVPGEGLVLDVAALDVSRLRVVPAPEPLPEDLQRAALAADLVLLAALVDIEPAVELPVDVVQVPAEPAESPSAEAADSDRRTADADHEPVATTVAGEPARAVSRSEAEVSGGASSSVDTAPAPPVAPAAPDPETDADLAALLRELEAIEDAEEAARNPAPACQPAPESSVEAAAPATDVPLEPLAASAPADASPSPGLAPAGSPDLVPGEGVESIPLADSASGRPAAAAGDVEPGTPRPAGRVEATKRRRSRSRSRRPSGAGKPTAAVFSPAVAPAPPGTPAAVTAPPAHGPTPLSIAASTQDDSPLAERRALTSSRESWSTVARRVDREPLPASPVAAPDVTVQRERVILADSPSFEATLPNYAPWLAGDPLPAGAAEASPLAVAPTIPADSDRASVYSPDPAAAAVTVGSASVGAPVRPLAPTADVPVAQRPVIAPAVARDGSTGPVGAAWTRSLAPVPDPQGDVSPGLLTGAVVAPPARRLAKLVPAIAAVVALLAAGGVGAYFALRPAGNGTLTIEASIVGLEVAVDGHTRGITPVTVELAAGRHTVEVRGHGSTRTLAVEVAAGRQTKQHVNWSEGRSTGSLKVTSTPGGAKVLIGGELRGVTPVVIEGLTAGHHQVSVEAEAGTVRRQIQVTAGVVSELDISIFSGWLQVFAPFKMEVREEGRRLGTSEDGKLLLSPGVHQLELVNTTYGVAEKRRVEITPGGTETLSIEAPAGAIEVSAPAGTQVFVDGELKATTPLAEPLRVTVGTHNVVLSHAESGQIRPQQVVTVRARQTTSIRF